MRELKFRLWNRADAKMWFHDLRWGSPSQHGSGWLRCVDDNLSSVWRSGGDVSIPVDPNDCEIMQYTGLQDSNDVEIYEGDVVQYLQHRGYLLPDFIAEVCFANGAFGYQVDSDSALWRAFAECDELDIDLLPYMTVIGNIYENPELLGGE